MVRVFNLEYGHKGIFKLYFLHSYSYATVAAKTLLSDRFVC